MPGPSDEFRERYRHALAAYVLGKVEEIEAVDPLGLGRFALDQGRGLLDILSIHQSLLASIIGKSSSTEAVARALERAHAFLTEIAAPFEMTHRGWHDVVGRLHRLNESLERQVEERTARLRYSERRFQDIAEVSGDWIWETDREHRFTGIFGESAPLDALTESLIGKTRWEVADVDPAADEHWACHKADLDAHRPFRRFRYEITTASGGRMFILSSGKPVFDERGDFLGYRGTSTDETMIAEVQRRIKETEQLLRDAIDSIAGGVAIWDEDRLVMCNEIYRQLYPEDPKSIVPGVNYEELLRQGLARHQYPDAKAREEDWIAERLRQHRAAGGSTEQQLSDGRWVLVTRRRMTNGWIAGLRIDITAMKTAQMELSRSRDNLQRAQRIAHMGSITRNLVTGEGDWSDEAYHIFGVVRDQISPTTANLMSLVHPDDRATLRAARDQALAGIHPDPFEYRVIRPDGSVRLVYRESELIRDEAGNPLYLIGTIRDITDARAAQQRQQELERQLDQAQKMEAIGNLTGGMAHDFNNLLGVIIGNLDLVLERISSDAQLAEIVGEALEAAWRGADLTRRLLAFARRQPLRPAVIKLNELVSDTVRLLRRLLGEDIEILLALDPSVWAVEADPAQLEASLVNLATNARDAMPSGGVLSIQTKNALLDADYAAMHPELAPGEYAMIEVSDAGTGMSSETMRQIFEPFFTTKEPGKGTGLGLSMVYGFLKQSRGHINVYSEVGVGTTFRLYLPRVTAESVPEVMLTAPLVDRGAGERVLVVEDNPAMRRVVVRQLRELGYRVYEADRAAAALELLQHTPADLLFTDVVMPGGLDGVELAGLALERWPALKVLLTSGFSDLNVRHTQALSEKLCLLIKPYSKDELARALREALNQ